MEKETTLTGSVVKKEIAQGSKSARLALLLVVGDKEYVLRQHGGSAFGDPELDDLIGKNIKADGKVLGYNFIMTDWEVI